MADPQLCSLSMADLMTLADYLKKPVPERWNFWFFFKTFGPGIITASIATMAYMVARTQREIAANKYRMDLFNIRHEIVCDLEDGLSNLKVLLYNMKNNLNSENYDKLRLCYNFLLKNRLKLFKLTFCFKGIKNAEIKNLISNIYLILDDRGKNIKEDEIKKMIEVCQLVLKNILLEFSSICIPQEPY